MLLASGCAQETDDPEASPDNARHDTVVSVTDTATMEYFHQDSLRRGVSPETTVPGIKAIEHHAPDQHIIDSIKAHGSRKKK